VATASIEYSVLVQQGGSAKEAAATASALTAIDPAQLATDVNVELVAAYGVPAIAGLTTTPAASAETVSVVAEPPPTEAIAESETGGDDTSSASSGISGAVLAYVVVGGLVAVAFLVVGVVLVTKKRSTGTRPVRNDTEFSDPDMTTSMENPLKARQGAKVVS
jgi:hypothetical protein